MPDQDDIAAPLEARREELRRRKMLPEPVRRQEATAATLARFRHKSFDWREGRHCVRLAHFHMRQMGHKPPTLPRIRSALAAKRALKQRGWASVSDLLDTHLQKIAPAAMMLGDLAVVDGDEGFESIVLCLGPQKVLGWLPTGEEMAIYAGGISELKGAWRV